jgi:enterochelin esterase-like enzyme
VQLPTQLGHIIKSGAVTLSTCNKEALKMKAENNKIDINAIDKAFLKDVIGNMGDGKSIGNMLNQLKGLAEELQNEGLTITVSYKGDLVITVGSGAKPKISRIITRTNAVEINNLRKLVELAT